MNRFLIAFCLLVTAVSLAAAQKVGTLVGHVEIGPVSPVQRPGSPQKPSPEMYKHYRVEIQRLENGPVVIIQLDGEGNFTAKLAPGRYRITVPTKGRMPMPATPKLVAIQAGKTLKVEMKVDTGIR